LATSRACSSTMSDARTTKVCSNSMQIEFGTTKVCSNSMQIEFGVIAAAGFGYDQDRLSS
jgi:hypothetical protein